jgi:hypothetical protein
MWFILMSWCLSQHKFKCTALQLWKKITVQKLILDGYLEYTQQTTWNYATVARFIQYKRNSYIPIFINQHATWSINITGRYIPVLFSSVSSADS